MKRIIQTFVIVACINSFLLVEAEPVRQITWNDLIPANLMADDPVAKLPKDQQDVVYWVIS